MALAKRMFKLLGSKTRHLDQIAGWADLAFDAWEGSELTWEKFVKVVVWALTENEFTVENLRISREPGRSLFLNQWENIQIFYDAAEAKKVAILRKKGKTICPVCEMAEAKSREGLCDDCHAAWLEEYNRLAHMLHDLAERGLFRRTDARSGEKGTYMIFYPGADPASDAPALRGWFSSWHDQDSDHRRDGIVRDMLENPAMAQRFEEVWAMTEEDARSAPEVSKGEPPKGFDIEEA
jgi:hypothetical protein